MEGTEKKRHIRKRTIYAVILAVMLICLVMIVFLLLFQVRRIDVKGNEYLSSQEVADWLQEDDLAQNSLYAVIKYNLTDYELMPAMEEVKVGMKNPWTLEVTVTEKRIAGYITMGDDAVYFDKDGIVLAVTTEWWDNVPRIDGLSVDQVTLYKELPVSEENRQIFSSLLEMSQSLKQSDLSPDRIVCGGDGLYLFFGNVCVSLGDSNFSDRIAQIPPILEKLGDQTGTLHLENYGESSTTVSFRRDEIPQFESQTEEQ
ncbi:MAG TPA: hypothetical protein H9782_08030 [Candidatus Bariatricus faecipullorum]|nr:hypothetical protein [Candidatus Bariatricus faecipullorum]